MRIPALALLPLIASIGCNTTGSVNRVDANGPDAAAAQLQFHCNVAGVGVLLHIPQGFLQNAIERQLDAGGQPPI